MLVADRVCGGGELLCRSFHSAGFMSSHSLRHRHPAAVLPSRRGWSHRIETGRCGLDRIAMCFLALLGIAAVLHGMSF
ncbi:hypothetical protein [Bradyrhizobium japonicum]|uniref:hypothetical protein n=1 Tax=Bradyrhizobium japonicum TaxID=375 RepID=UPI001BABA513|nr:hypothetical protein [Bradyrhizobium japonicum]MBR0959852.1 hypothetical protein [Bradyrhizobium japonicum]